MENKKIQTSIKSSYESQNPPSVVPGRRGVEKMFD